MNRIKGITINIDRAIGLVCMAWGFIIKEPYLFAFGGILYIAGASYIKFE